MNTQVGKSLGIALLLAAGLLAALFAMGVFSASGVGAQTDPTSTPATLDILEVEAGGKFATKYQKGAKPHIYEHTVNVDRGVNQIKIQAKGVNGTVVSSPADADEDTTDTIEVDLEEAPAKVELTVKDGEPSDNTKADTNFDTMTYTLTLNYTDTDEVTSSTTAGAGVKVEVIGTFAAGVGDEIVVEMKGFGLPSSIDPDDVSLRIGKAGTISGVFEDATIDGSKITLSLADGDTGQGKDGNDDLGEPKDGENHTITFKTRVGITNPTKAGLYAIIITDEDGDTDDSVNVATVIRTISLDPKSGPSGADVTITGKGFSDGTATVFIDGTRDDDVDTKDDDEAVMLNGMYDSGVDTVIGSIAISDGSFTLTTDAIKKGDEGSAMVNAVDSSNAVAMESATYTFKAGLTIEPEKTSWGKKITITLKDWSHGEVTRVRFGGTETVPVDEAGDEEVKVTVPGGLRPGKLTVQVYTGNILQTGVTGNIEIEPLSLTVTPSSVVPGQRVTISGSGFEGNTDIDEDVVFGDDEFVSPPDDARTSTNGSASVTIMVPSNVGTGDKDVKLTVGDREGQGKITVAKPSITLSPSESLIGSTVTVTGSGFVSNGRVLVDYGTEVKSLEIGKAASDGDLSMTFTVPSKAGIGQTNTVKVYDIETDTVKAEANHMTPEAMITVSEEAQVGGSITVKGQNWNGFTTVTEVIVGEVNQLPSPAPEADRDGSFEFITRVPSGLSLGSHTVIVAIGEDTATAIFSVVAEPVVVEPVVTDPAELFAELGARLLRVWEFDNATQQWSFYDPRPDRADFNSLTEVSSGDIATIIISSGAPIAFQGTNLYPGGTSVVVLK